MKKTTSPSRRRSARHYSFEIPRCPVGLGISPIDLSAEPRGHLLHRSISDSLRTGVTSNALGVGVFTDFDNDDVSTVDVSVDFRADRLVRIEQGIDAAFTAAAPSLRPEPESASTPDPTPTSAPATPAADPSLDV